MLAKANREFDRMEKSFNIDNVFNFFVTAYHIQDYLKKTKAVNPKQLDEFLARPQIKMSRDVCDKAKHLTLTYKNRTDPGAEIVSSDWSASGEIWILTFGRKSVSAKMLATNTIDLWNEFFEQNNI